MKKYFFVLIIMFYGFSIQANELIEVVKDKESIVSDIRDVLKYGGVAINDRDVSGNTALHWAYYMKRADIIDFLLTAGASSEIKNTAGDTASEVGLTKGYTHIKQPVKSEHPSIRTASIKRFAQPNLKRSFINIVNNGNVNSVSQYLSQRSVNDYTLGRALHVVMDRPEVNQNLLFTLLSSAGNVHFVDSYDGRTLLQKAAAKGDVEAVRTLLSFGAHPNSPASVLMDGIRGGSPEVASVLLTSGAKIEDIDQALLEAARTGKPQMTSVLLEANTKQNINGEKALNLAAEQGRKDMFFLLLESGAHFSRTTLRSAVLGGDTEIVSSLIDRGVNLHESNWLRKGVHLYLYGEVGLLYSVVEQQKIKLLSILLDAGVPVDERVLRYAERSGDTEVFKLLLKYEGGTGNRCANGFSI